MPWEAISYHQPPPNVRRSYTLARRFVFDDGICCRRYHVVSNLVTRLYHEKQRTLIGVEIGVNNAITSRFLLKLPFVNLTGIDPFIDVSPDIIDMSYAVFANYPDRSRLLRAKSEDLIARIPDDSLDFVFIDGDHSFEAVKKDLRMWHPKVKKGGLVSGHDLFNPAFEGVNEALLITGKEHTKVHFSFDYVFYWWRRN